MLSVNFNEFASFDHTKNLESGAIAVMVRAEGTEGTSTKMGQAATALDQSLGGAITRALGVLKYSGKAGEVAHLPAPGALNNSGTAVERVFLFGISNDSATSAAKEILNWQDAGGHLGKASNQEATKSIHVVLDNEGDEKQGRLAAELAFGMVVGTYYFHQYFTKLKPSEIPTLKHLHIHLSKIALKAAKHHWDNIKGLAEAIFYTRNIVSEPGNVIHPESLSDKCKELTKYGLEVEVLDEAKLKKLGMGALLGVGQGSIRESRMVIMQWKGGKKGDAPIALIGKGITFDSGGISLKQADGMEEMKWDMGGSAAVIGTMIASAIRKADINIVGVIALAENMPDGGAQRPGDVVKSLSGQTIEIINTDAEGRLVLADALHYTQSEFKPKLMIDLATLTGAILIALGHEYAGLFSNDDTLANDLYQASQNSGERLWRFPMDPAYDKMIKSEIADMRNTGINRGAGSITAAQFLMRFVKDTPWAHLDIAGMAWNKQDRAIVPKGASGFGVRLLDEYIRKFHG